MIFLILAFLTFPNVIAQSGLAEEENNDDNLDNINNTLVINKSTTITQEMIFGPLADPEKPLEEPAIVFEPITKIVCSSVEKSTLTIDKGVDTSKVSILIENGSWDLGSSLNIAGLNIESDFNSRGNSISSSNIFIGTEYNSKDSYTVDLSNSIISSPWFCVYRGQSNINLITTNTTINSQYFFGGGKTYSTVILNGTGSCNLEDDNFITTLRVNSNIPCYIRGTNKVINMEKLPFTSFKVANTGKPILVSSRESEADKALPDYAKSCLVAESVK